MKVPLIGVCSPYTRNLETGELQSVIWRDGKKEVHVAPYEPYVYVPDSETGQQYRLTGQQGSMLLRKEPYRAGEELPSSLILDGGRENVMDRLVIEHPDYFYKHPNDNELKSLCFDIALVVSLRAFLTCSVEVFFLIIYILRISVISIH